jgi:hypothetical protein
MVLVLAGTTSQVVSEGDIKVVGGVGGEGNGVSTRMVLPLECTMSQTNGSDKEVVGEVAGEGDGMSGMALTSACTTSQANGGDNEVIGKVEGGTVCIGLTTTTKLYSIHQIIISDTRTIGINLKWQPELCRCCISSVHADSIARHHGVEEGDKILAPRITSGEEISNVHEFFQSASKHRPLLFEIKRRYKPPTSNTNILLPGCHSLHWFTITKSGPLGVFLEIENTGMVRVKSVTLNSLGGIYGLRENDILCKPLKNGASDI